MNRRTVRVINSTIKHLFDRIAAFFLLIVFLPLWIVIAMIIKGTSTGPVFFLQDRPGYRRKLFRIYKFRTMYPGSEQMVKGREVMTGDARVTELGKILRRTKLDEVPQLLNVLKGEMSLVGPRPERVSSLEDYTEYIERRLDMKPGLTGLAQVSGNIYLTLQERYQLDVYYVEHFSLVLDLRILFRTFGVILFGEKHYRDRPLIKKECRE